MKELLVKLYFLLIEHIWFLRPIYETYNTGARITLRGLFFQKALRFNGNVPWPVHFSSIVSGWQYISIGINTAPGISIGNYIFSSKDAPIEIGDYTVIASNVCIGSYNHDLYDISKYTNKGGISIGKYCWIGANAVVLTGVKLGDHTVVAAGAVVTKPFPTGCCVLAGNPARIVKHLDETKINKFEHRYKYCGFKKIG